MRIAVAYNEDGTISQHFGKTAHFKFFDIEDGKVTHSAVVHIGADKHCSIVSDLQAGNADAVICGGIGNGAVNKLNAAGIELYAGVKGTADQAIADLLNQTLVYSSVALCEDHDHHHAEGEACSHH